MRVNEYTYKLPADYTIKPETREKLDKLVYQLGLSNEQAQEFIDLHVELMEEYAAGAKAYMEERIAVCGKTVNPTKESTNVEETN